MFGIPALFIPWIIKGVAVLAVVLSVWGFVAIHDSKVRKAEAAKWEPKLVACDAEREQAAKANLTLQEDVAKLNDLYKKQTLAMKALQDAEARAKAAGSAALLKALERERALLGQVDAYLAIMNGPASANKEDACNEANRILDRIVDERLRK
jgi:hypothetical protein